MGLNPVIRVFEIKKLLEVEYLTSKLTFLELGGTKCAIRVKMCHYMNGYVLVFLTQRCHLGIIENKMEQKGSKSIKYPGTVCVIQYQSMFKNPCHQDK